MQSVIGKKRNKKKCNSNCAYLGYPYVGISLSTVGKSIVQINPDLPEANKLRSW